MNKHIKQSLAVTLASFFLLLLFSVASAGQQPDLQDRQIFDIIRSGDGQVLALNYGTEMVDLIDAATGDVIHRADLPEIPRRLILDQNGTRLFWSDNMANMNLYDVESRSNSVLSYGTNGAS